MWSPAAVITSSASAAQAWSGLTRKSLPASVREESETDRADTVFGSGSVPPALLRTWCSASRPRILVSLTNRSTLAWCRSGTSNRSPTPRSTFSTATRQRCWSGRRSKSSATYGNSPGSTPIAVQMWSRIATANSGNAEPTCSTRLSSLAALSRRMRADFWAYSASVEASRPHSSLPSISVACLVSASRSSQNSSALSGTSMPWAVTNSSNAARRRDTSSACASAAVTWACSGPTFALAPLIVLGGRDGRRDGPHRRHRPRADHHVLRILRSDAAAVPHHAAHRFLLRGRRPRREAARRG